MEDSEEKIVEEWNKIWEPDRLSRAFGERSDNVFPVETGFDSVYRQLEQFAKGSGERAPKKEVNRA